MADIEHVLLEVESLTRRNQFEAAQSRLSGLLDTLSSGELRSWQLTSRPVVYEGLRV